MRVTACVLGLVLAAATPAFADFVPAAPIELVVHGGPGSGPDTFGRAIAHALEKEKIVPVRIKIDNKTGGSGSTAMSYIVEHRGDNGVLGAFAMLWLSNPLTLKEADVSVDQMTTICRLIEEPALIVTRADSPYASLMDFIEAAKKAPGKLMQAGGSITARDAVMRQMLMGKTGTNWVFISFPGGGERLAALLGGHADLLMAEPQEIGEQVRAGKVRVLAQVSNTRLPEYPDVPTVQEIVDVPYIPQGRGIVGPPDMSPEAVKYYVDVFRKLSTSPTWLEFLKANQMTQAFAGPEETKAFFKDFVEQMRGVFRAAGIEVVR